MGLSKLDGSNQEKPWDMVRLPLGHLTLEPFFLQTHAGLISPIHDITMCRLVRGYRNCAPSSQLRCIVLRGVGA